MVKFYGNEISWVPQIEKTEIPIYIQIASSIEADIESGKLKFGFRLPSQRLIASYMGINHSTVTRAYKLCESKGLLQGIIGKGTYVNVKAGIPNGLSTNLVDSHVIEMGLLLPLAENDKTLIGTMNKLNELMDYDVVLNYSPAEGHPKHRNVAANWLTKHGVFCKPENVLVASGSQNAIASILISFFEKGDRLLVDEHTYPGLTSLAVQLGITLIPIKWNGDSMDLNLLKIACKNHSVKGVYVMPDCQNPYSITMSENKRAELAQIISQNNLLLIEDGAFRFCSDLSLPPISGRIPANAIYIAGVSKLLNPTFRTAYIVTPDKCKRKLIQTLNNLNFMTSPLLSEYVALLQASGAFDDEVIIKRMIYKKRNAFADEILGEFEMNPTEYSPFRWLVLPADLDDYMVEKSCLEIGVQVFSAKRFSTGVDSRIKAIRIAVGSPKNNQETVRGLLRIKQVIESHLANRTI